MYVVDDGTLETISATATAESRAEAQVAVDEADKAVSHARAIKEFRLFTRDPSVAGGELTPPLVVRRSVVFAKHAGPIDDVCG